MKKFKNHNLHKTRKCKLLDIKVITMTLHLSKKSKNKQKGAKNISIIFCKIHLSETHVNTEFKPIFYTIN